MFVPSMTAAFFLFHTPSSHTHRGLNFLGVFSIVRTFEKETNEWYKHLFYVKLNKLVCLCNLHAL